MKRSEVNAGLKWALELLDTYKIHLPHFAYWTTDEWKENKEQLDMIRKVMLGWDITDYGLNQFETTGGVLYTLRNGDQDNKDIGVPYAEKYILFKDGQGIPMHYHVTKTEDIINRAGGVMALELYNALPDGEIDKENDVVVYCDGIKKIVKPGEIVKVYPGDSITLTPFMYHKFWAVEGEGDTVIGEVSSVNDDNTDNYFYDKLPRFGKIDEDTDVLYPLVIDYDNVLGK